MGIDSFPNLYWCPENLIERWSLAFVGAEVENMARWCEYVQKGLRELGAELHPPIFNLEKRPYSHVLRFGDEWLAVELWQDVEGLINEKQSWWFSFLHCGNLISRVSRTLLAIGARHARGIAGCRRLYVGLNNIENSVFDELRWNRASTLNLPTGQELSGGLRLKNLELPVYFGPFVDILNSDQLRYYLAVDCKKRLFRKDISTEMLNAIDGLLLPIGYRVVDIHL